MYALSAFTFLDVLVLVEGLYGVILGEAPEGVDEMGAHVRVDVLGAELGRALAVDRPIGKVADHTLPIAGGAVVCRLSFCYAVLLLLLLQRIGFF